MGAGLAGGTQWQAPSRLAVADQSRWACASASLQRCVDIIQGRGVAVPPDVIPAPRGFSGRPGGDPSGASTASWLRLHGSTRTHWTGLELQLADALPGGRSCRCR